ncbi:MULTISPECIES: FecR family protein [Sphingobacterium]|uniref:FecR family protein n=1 Tax=Sphingobacterium TaxID=28453 RepID=UPI00104A78E0|nr:MULTISPECIES: FecR family protein [Sphingobacterium]MCW2263107.1 hypothetical protein [Sphingobacterium kitahiroshimense]
METHKIQAVEKLFYKIYNNTASVQERYDYYELILNDYCAQHVQDLMEQILIQEEGVTFTDVDRRVNVYSRIIQQLSFTQPIRRSMVSFYWTAAAAVLLFFFLGIYHHQQLRPIKYASEIEKDIAPGGESATLILGDGREIALSTIRNGEIAHDHGIKISNDSQGQITYSFAGTLSPKAGLNTIKTRNGETYKVQLADGTKVWLNAASTLQFRADLQHNGTRQVQLVGEAYFEVAKDAKHPFVVHTSQQTIRVLGTHFNVSAYQNNPTGATTVLEGRVSVKHQASEHVLNAGEQALTSTTGTVVTKTDPKSAVDWQQGDFALNNIKFDDAMQKIARWYNIEVIYESNIDKAMLTGGWVSKKQPLSAVLRAIESLDQVRFERKGRTLIVRSYQSK